MYELDKVLPAGTCFPFDFGFIPRTMAADGDPLDIMVPAECASFTGCLIECRIIGVMEAIQKEKDGVKERNDRIIAVSSASKDYSDLKELTQLDKNYLQELTHFFEYYNSMNGKKFKIEGLKDSPVALALVKKHLQKEK